MRKKFYRTLTAIVIIAVNVLGFNGFKQIQHQNIEKLYCGTVVSSCIKERAVKHGSQTTLYTIVKFDSELGTKAIAVTPTTYYTSNEGERVCFTLDMREAFGYYPNMLLVICMFLAAAICLYYIWCAGYWLIENFNSILDAFDEKKF